MRKKFKPPVAVCVRVLVPTLTTMRRASFNVDLILLNGIASQFLAHYTTVRITPQLLTLTATFDRFKSDCERVKNEGALR